MRETKHTPGPWFVAEGVEGYPDIVTKDGISIIGNEGFYGDFCQDWINAHLVASAPELLEENQEWASLIGQVYVMLQQDDAKGALKLIREENIITFKDGSPVAASCVGVLAYKAEGGE